MQLLRIIKAFLMRYMSALFPILLLSLFASLQSLLTPLLLLLLFSIFLKERNDESDRRGANGERDENNSRIVVISMTSPSFAFPISSFPPLPHHFLFADSNQTNV